MPCSEKIKTLTCSVVKKMGLYAQPWGVVTPKHTGLVLADRAPDSLTFLGRGAMGACPGSYELKVHGTGYARFTNSPIKGSGKRSGGVPQNSSQ